MEEGESGAGEKGGNEEKGEESCSTAEGGELALPPKRSRRRTALSVHLVDLNELSVKLGIPLEDDASDSEFEPSVEDLGMHSVCVLYVLRGVGSAMCVCRCVCVCKCVCVCVQVCVYVQVCVCWCVCSEYCCSVFDVVLWLLEFMAKWTVVPYDFHFAE